VCDYFHKKTPPAILVPINLLAFISICCTYYECKQATNTATQNHPNPLQQPLTNQNTTLTDGLDQMEAQKTPDTSYTILEAGNAA